MKVTSVKINNFRNISELTLIPSEGINVIHGKNAQGKTNILEAIWLFTGCKSFRGSKDKELIRFGTDFYKNELCFENGTREKKAFIAVNEKKKLASLNGVALSSTSELISELRAVVFSPTELSLIKGAPAERRKFLDVALCQLKPKYAEYLKEYKHALFQRNILLKDLYFSPRLEEILDSWDEAVARQAAIIIYERLKYTELLRNFSKEIYSGISDNKEDFEIKYSSTVNIYDVTIRDIYLSALEELLKKRKDDIYFKTTTIGPHRDDLTVTVNGKNAKSFASQGQQRSAALALKLGEARVIEEITNEKPIALLDDVMSELDERRQDYILNSIREMQVFLTCCDPSQVMRMCDGKSFLIENGKLFGN